MRPRQSQKAVRKAACAMAVAGSLFTSTLPNHALAQAQNPGEAQSDASDTAPPASIVADPRNPHVARGKAPPPRPAAASEGSLPQGPLGPRALVDAALRLNPRTRIRWAQAKAAAAEVGSARAPYYPNLDFLAEVSTVYNQKTMPALFRATNIGPTMELTWLLLDFGGRAATLEGAKWALAAANQEYDQTVQDVVLSVLTAYHVLAGELALAVAANANLKSAQVSLNAADRRREDGVGTVTDVYLARAREAQSRLEVVKYQGAVESAYGRLATSLGVPANTTFEVALPEGRPSLDAAGLDVNHLIQEALKSRPALAAARSRRGQAEAALARSEAALWPTIDTKAGVAWMDPSFGESGGNPIDHGALNYDAGLFLRWPLFEGFRLRDDIKRSRAQAEQAKARVRLSEETVTLEVWNSFQALVTADQSLLATDQLIASARLSYEATLEAYQAGVATITRLVEALSLLAQARYEYVDARTDWYVSLAALARSVGRISKTGTFGTPASAGARAND